LALVAEAGESKSAGNKATKAEKVSYGWLTVLTFRLLSPFAIFSLFLITGVIPLPLSSRSLAP